MPPWYPLFSSHELTIDDKGRLLVPSEIRKTLETQGESDELILMNMSGRASLYPARYWYEQFGTIKMGRLPTPEEQRLAVMLFGRSTKLGWDKAGRILLSPRLLETYGLEREKPVMLVCGGDHMQLWPAAEWEADQVPQSKEMPGLLTKHAPSYGPGFAKSE